MFCSSKRDRHRVLSAIPDHESNRIPNKMPILAFTSDAVPDLFPLYPSQIFKALLPSKLKYCLTVLEIIPELLSENVMTEADTYLTHVIIPEIAFGVRLQNVFVSQTKKEKEQKEKQAKSSPK